MQTILATLLALSVTAGLAGAGSAAAQAAARSPAVHVAAMDDYDNPGFGSEQWWNQQQDRGG